MENLLKKEVQYQWIEEFQMSLDTLKQKIVTVTILVFPNSSKEFHVHVDSSSIVLRAILEQTGEGEIDHLISFMRRKL
jgi:hypothetical protein